MQVASDVILNASIANASRQRRDLLVGLLHVLEDLGAARFAGEGIDEKQGLDF